MRRAAAVLSFFIWFAGPAFAGEFQCEVLSVKGAVKVIQGSGESAALKEGDLLKKGAKIETAEGAEADIAFDKDWKNILRIETESAAELSSIFPAKVGLEKGGLFAKLRQIPKDSSFEVQTPTALAAVRGTEYRTTFEGGQTQVFNSSNSEVFVYGRDAAGNASGEPVVLAHSQKTTVTKTGESPKPGELMSTDETKKGEEMKTAIEEKVEEAGKAGRIGKIQDVTALEKSLLSKGPVEEAESRVVDTRRRVFKKD